MLGPGCPLSSLALLTTQQLDTLSKDFGRKTVSKLPSMGVGEDDSEVTPRGPPSCIIVERSFSASPTNLSLWTETLAGDLLKRVLARGAVPKSIVMRWRSGYTSLSTTASKTVPTPMQLRSYIASLLSKGSIPTPSTPVDECDVARAEATIESESDNGETPQGQATSEAIAIIVAECGKVIRGVTGINRLVIGAQAFDEADPLQSKNQPTLAAFLGAAPTASRTTSSDSHSVPHTPASSSRTRKEMEPAVEMPSVDEGTPSGKAPCPICGRSIIRRDLESHANSHFLDDPRVKRMRIGASEARKITSFLPPSSRR